MGFVINLSSNENDIIKIAVSHRILKLSLLFLVTFHITCLARSYEFIFSGLGIEIGGGHNTLLWSAPFNIRTPGGVAVDRTHLSFTPNIRLIYNLKLIDGVSALPFIGYNQFGGFTADDKYVFDVKEFGFFILYNTSTLVFGVGGKINSHQKVKYHVGSSDWDRSKWFTKQSRDIGIRASYLLTPINFTVESWFGLTNLANGPLTGAELQQNHFRFLIGYTM